MKRRNAIAILFLVSSTRVVLASPLDSLVRELTKGASSLKEKRVAVLVFPYPDGKISSGSALVSDRIANEISGKKGISVVERNQLEKVLVDKNLSESVATIPENLRMIGSSLDVDAVVTGTLIDLPSGKTEIHAHLLRTQSGEVLATGEEAIMRTWKDSPVLPVPPAVAP